MSDVYTKIIKILLSEAKDQKEELNDIPDEDVIADGLLLKDKNGFKLEITQIGKSKKTGKKLFKLKGDNYSKIIDYNTLKQNYKRA
jgi:hypothetical protein